MNITAHAAKRCKQRGIPEYIMELIPGVGSIASKPVKASLSIIGKKEVDMMIHELKALIQQLDRLKRTKIGVVVADGDSTVLTTYKLV